MTKTDVAKQYREKYGQEMPTLKLARIMYAENELLFKDVEDCRKFLRYIEGKYRNLKNGSTYPKTPDRVKNPYNLPKSDAVDYTPFVIPESKILIMSDIHIPYHDVKAITSVFEFMEVEGTEAILLNGDILDFYGLSRFVRDPKARSVAGELEMLAEFYNVILQYFNVPIYYKLGNHEERYDHFLYMKAAELTGVPEFTLEKVIENRMPGVQMIKDKRIVKFGNLNIIHGHEYNSGIFQSVNVARGLFLKSKVSSLQGHSHQVSEHTETDMNDNITTTWSVGCLCDMHPDYAKLNRWSQGFAVAQRKGNNFSVKNYRIHKGVIL
jgi:predicted phosphodiesterase